MFAKSEGDGTDPLYVEELVDGGYISRTDPIKFMGVIWKKEFGEGASKSESLPDLDEAYDLKATNMEVTFE